MDKELGEIQYQQGFEDADRMRVAELLDEAFERKLAAAITHKATRLKFMSQVINPASMMVAIEAGKIVGVGAFSDESDHAFTEENVSEVAKELGFFQGMRAAIVFRLFELKPKPNAVVIDAMRLMGKCVAGVLARDLSEKWLNTLRQIIEKRSI